MFTEAQLAIIETRGYAVVYNIMFELPTGIIKWTTLPFDYNGYQSENFIDGISSFKQAAETIALTSSIGIIGVPSTLAAFHNCQGSKVTIDMGIYRDVQQIEWASVFTGSVDKYGIKREIGRTVITLELTDHIGNSMNTNSRLLTPSEQLKRYPTDFCLEFMANSQEAVFWGKEVD